MKSLLAPFRLLPRRPTGKQQRSPWTWKTAGMAALALIPAILLAVLVEQNAVNVPTWDDWERGKLLRQWHEGTLSPADLWAAHLEHRPVVPRIVMLACNQLSGGDLRWEMALTLLSAVAASLTILLLLLRTAGSHPATFFAYFLINLVIFSPMQWENWLWATQTALMLPFLCLVAVVAVMTLPGGVTEWSGCPRLIAGLGIAPESA